LSAASQLLDLESLLTCFGRSYFHFSAPRIGIRRRRAWAVPRGASISQAAGVALFDSHDGLSLLSWARQQQQIAHQLQTLPLGDALGCSARYRTAACGAGGYPAFPTLASGAVFFSLFSAETEASALQACPPLSYESAAVASRSCCVRSRVAFVELASELPLAWQAPSVQASLLPQASWAEYALQKTGRRSAGFAVSLVRAQSRTSRQPPSRTLPRRRRRNWSRADVLFSRFRAFRSARVSRAFGCAGDGPWAESVSAAQSDHEEVEVYRADGGAGPAQLMEAAPPSASLRCRAESFWTLLLLLTHRQPTFAFYPLPRLGKKASRILIDALANPPLPLPHADAGRVDLSAVRHNVAAVRSQVGPAMHIMASSRRTPMDTARHHRSGPSGP
jgi:hypothetical protein